MQDPLIAASPKLKGNVLQFLNKLPIHQNINAGEHAVCVRCVDPAAWNHIFVEKIA